MPDTLSQRLADITLPDAFDNQVRLGSLWESHAAVLVFLRHYGWIFCREHVAQLREHQPAFRAKNASLAAISLGDARYARLFQEEEGIDFPLLLDADSQIYKLANLRKANLLHLLRGDNFQSRSRAKAAGHRQHKLGRDPFQLGGAFIFGPGNIDRFAHLSRTFGDNASPESLLAVL